MELTFVGQKYILYLCQTIKGGEKVKKLGRPTDNPRPNKISIRISDEDKKILEDYCQECKVNKTEAICRGIKMLKENK